MGLHINSWNPFNWTFERYTNGDSFLNIGTLSAKYGDVDNLIRQTVENYALFICLKISADISSKARIELQDADGKKIEGDDPLLNLLHNPNYLQTQGDFIKQFVWNKLSEGTSVIRPIAPVGFTRDAGSIKAMYNLNAGAIRYPDNFRTPQLYEEADIREFNSTIVTYPDGDKKLKLSIGELLYCYDVAAGIGGDMLHSPSRVKAVRKAIGNVDLAIDAENIMIQSNGREMFSGGSGKGSESGAVMPMLKQDRQEITDKLVNVYGLSRDKVRSIVTERGINWQSLHIALKDLGLWESAAKNTAIIRAAFQIPETVFKVYLEGGDTFENKREGEVELIQNVGQVNMQDFCSSLNSFFGYEEQGKYLTPTFDHLEAMQYVEQRRADRVLKISTAVRNLTQAGYSNEEIRAFMADNQITM